MAKIVEDVIVIKFSKLVKDGSDGQQLAGQEIQQALEQVAQELVGDSVIVEVIKE
jgi:histone H3/H4